MEVLAETGFVTEGARGMNDLLDLSVLSKNLRMAIVYAEKKSHECGKLGDHLNALKFHKLASMIKEAENCLPKDDLMTDGYKSTDKRQAVEYIARVSNQLVVVDAAKKALAGKATLDSALVTAHKVGRQSVIKDTANAALGIDE